MNQFDIEKKVWTSWRKRFGQTSLGAYEIKSVQALEKQTKVTPLSFSLCIKALRSYEVIFFGDDVLVEENQEAISKIVSTLSKPNSIFLTDRKKTDWKGSKKQFLFLKPWHSLIASDHAFIAKIKNLKSKKKPIFVWTGELRLEHLAKLCKKNEINGAFVHLQAKELRWKFKKDKEIVTWGAHFAFLENNPLVALDYFRIWSQGFGLKVSVSQQVPFFNGAVQFISKKIKIKKTEKPKAILTPFARKHWPNLSPSVQAFVKDRIFRAESAVLPQQGVVLLSSLEKGHIAEEAAHFVRLSREHIPMGSYRIIVEEGFAFLGGLWLDPTRKIPDAKGDRSSPWKDLHLLGYQLGEKLFKSWNRGPRFQTQIRKLWHLPIKNEATAYGVWLQLNEVGKKP